MVFTRSSMPLVCVVFIILICGLSATANNNTFDDHHVQNLDHFKSTVSVKTVGGERNREPELLPCVDCKCGVKQLRLIGGTNIDKVDTPWMVALDVNYTHICAGTLLTYNYVLTAAHCVKKSKNDDSTWVKKEMYVNLATRVDYSASARRYIAEVKIHPRFNHVTFEHDIALLKLQIWTQMKRTLQPVCLPSVGGFYASKEAAVLGWSSPDPKIAFVQYVNVKVNDEETCRLKNYSYPLTKNMMCAGDKQHFCKEHDGGGGDPLLFRNAKNKTMIIGISSFGNGCSTEGEKVAPGVYTKVDKYLGWIQDNTNDTCYCH